MRESETDSRKKLLLYANYYPPDVASTGQLMQELAEGISVTFKVTVVSAVPCYGGKIDENYRAEKYYRENVNGVEVIRIRVPSFDKTRKMSRVKNIIAYFLRAMWATLKVKNVDVVFSVSQPPILGGLLGVWGKWTRRAKYIYNIQDFNPEQTIATGYSKNRFVLKLMMWLDKFSCKRADKVIVVGRDMAETLKKRFAGKKVPDYAIINNWIDEKKIFPLPLDAPEVKAFREKYGLADKFVFMYSGNIGLYYDLENLMKVIACFPAGTQAADGREVAFAFVGDGAIKGNLQTYAQEHGMKNVVFIPYQDKADLNYSLNAADVHWCVNAKGIKGVSVPSKLYGVMAAGKPVLGVLEEGSEARLIIEETCCGVVCEPGEYEQIEKNIRRFVEPKGSKEFGDMGARGRTCLVERLTKDASIVQYIRK